MFRLRRGCIINFGKAFLFCLYMVRYLLGYDCRFERVSCVQLSGFMNHQKQSNPVYSADSDDEESFKVSLGDWMVMYDSEKYTCAHYGEVLNHLLTGAPFEATNIPRGYTYKPWTIKELLGKIERREKIHFEGDWS